MKQLFTFFWIIFFKANLTLAASPAVLSIPIDPILLKENIIKFINGAEEERYEVAVLLSFNLKLLSMEINKRITLTNEEREALHTADKYVNKVNTQVAEFEQLLSITDVAQITRSNPESFFKISGYFTSNSTLRESQGCSDKNYSDLKSLLGLETISSVYFYSGAIVSTFDSIYITDYAKEIVMLLKERPEYQKFKTLTSYYNYLSQSKVGKNFLVKFRESKVREASREMGIPENEVKNYFFKMAQVSPGCLGVINFSFIENVMKDITLTRGQFILEKLNSLLKGKGHVSVSALSILIEEIELDLSSSLFGSTLDAWYFNYYFLQQQDDILMVSYGRDGVASNDDLIIGQVVIP